MQVHKDEGHDDGLSKLRTLSSIPRLPGLSAEELCCRMLSRSKPSSATLAISHGPAHRTLQELMVTCGSKLNSAKGRVPVLRLLLEDCVGAI